MALSVRKRRRHRFSLAPGRLSQQEAIPRYIFAERDLCLLPPRLDRATALLTLPCSLPMHWMWLPAPANGEGAGGQPGAALSGPRGTCHSHGLGLTASAALKDRNRPAPELGPCHWFFLSPYNTAAMRGAPPSKDAQLRLIE